MPITQNSAAAAKQPELDADQQQQTAELIDGITLDEKSIPHEEIARRAYHCWKERGCPEGSPDVDWNRAERELRERGLELC
jgi:hypothetical protein